MLQGYKEDMTMIKERKRDYQCMSLVLNEEGGGARARRAYPFSRQAKAWCSSSLAPLIGLPQCNGAYLLTRPCIHT